MNPRQLIFTISLVIGLFWLLGFILEPILNAEPPIWLGVLLSAVISVIVSYFVFKQFPNFLTKIEGAKVSSLKYYLVSLVASYILLVPLCGAVSYLAVKLFGDISHHEAPVFIILMEIWFPLWWFCPVGLSFGWYFYKRKANEINNL